MKLLCYIKIIIAKIAEILISINFRKEHKKNGKKKTNKQSEGQQDFQQNSEKNKSN